jgi:hypothetical protein
MATLAKLESLYGTPKAEQLLSYLKSKHQGGINNSKGNTFENFFAIYKIALLAKKNVKDKDNLISSQVSCFVDDLAIEMLAVPSADYFQIKDVATLSWDSGHTYTIKDDFELQLALGKSEGIDTRCIMVVSKKSVYDSLKKETPEAIKGKTDIIHFNTAASINQLIQVNKDFKDAISDICAINSPSIDKMETVATIILGVWDASDKTKATIEQLLKKCYSINPNYIAGFESSLPSNVESIFQRIDGLSFKVENSYLVWNYKSTDTGVLPFPIGSKEFLQWENDLSTADLGIQTFEDLEHFLS